MRTFPELLQYFFARAGITRCKDMASRLGVDSSQVGRYLSGESRPSPEKVLVATKLLGLTEEEGTQFLLASFQLGMDSIAAKALEKIRQQLSTQSPPHIRHTDAIEVPIYRSIRCGDDTEGEGVTGEVVETLPLSWPEGKGLFGLIAAGDSMWGPPGWIADGWRVLFRPCQPRPIPIGKICCLAVEGYSNPLCKRVKLDQAGLVLASDNPVYPPIFIAPEQQVIIHGIWAGTWVPAVGGEKIQEG